jgi:hypothetical protein
MGLKICASSIGSDPKVAAVAVLTAATRAALLDSAAQTPQGQSGSVLS